MPLYEYRCTSCGHQQEFLQKWSDAPITVCTACGKETFTKLLSAAGFQLKGTGWYATDFKNKGSKPAAKSESKDGKASEGKTSEGKASEGKTSEGKASEGKASEGKASGGESKGETKKDAGPASGSGASAASS
jgi:putative FmdB family regulatory protein